MEVAQGIQKLRQCLCKTHQLDARLKRRIGTKNNKANHVRIQSFFSMKVTGDNMELLSMYFSHYSLLGLPSENVTSLIGPNLFVGVLLCVCLCRSVVEFQSHGRDQTARQNHRIALFVFELVLGVEDVRMASLFA